MLINVVFRGKESGPLQKFGQGVLGFYVRAMTPDTVVAGFTERRGTNEKVGKEQKNMGGTGGGRKGESQV